MLMNVVRFANSTDPSGPFRVVLPTWFLLAPQILDSKARCVAPTALPLHKGVPGVFCAAPTWRKKRHNGRIGWPSCVRGRMLIYKARFRHQTLTTLSAHENNVGSLGSMVLGYREMKEGRSLFGMQQEVRILFSLMTYVWSYPSIPEPIFTLYHQQFAPAYKYHEAIY